MATLEERVNDLEQALYDSNMWLIYPDPNWTDPTIFDNDGELTAAAKRSWYKYRYCTIRVSKLKSVSRASGTGDYYTAGDARSVADAMNSDYRAAAIEAARPH